MENKMRLGKTDKNNKLLIVSLFVFMSSVFFAEVSVADARQMLNQAVINGLKQSELTKGIKTVPPATEDVVTVITQEKEPINLKRAS